MANIRIDLDTPIVDGQQLIFRSPIDCSSITGLIVYYRSEDGSKASRTFQFADAHGNNVGDLDHLFTSDVLVKVILDVETSRAYVQNADTNKYLEERFDGIKYSLIRRMTQAEFDALEYVDPNTMYVIEDAVSDSVKIKVGSYVGTGGDPVTSDKPISIVLPGKPVFFHIQTPNVNNLLVEPWTCNNPSFHASIVNGTVGFEFEVNVSGNILSFYRSYSNSSGYEGDTYHFNSAGVTYNYIALYV